MPGCRKHPICADGSAVPVAMSREASAGMRQGWCVTKRPLLPLQVLWFYGAWGGVEGDGAAGNHLPLTACPLGSAGCQDKLRWLGGEMLALCHLCASGWGTAVPLSTWPPNPYMGALFLPISLEVYSSSCSTGQGSRSGKSSSPLRCLVVLLRMKGSTALLFKSKRHLPRACPKECATTSSWYARGFIQPLPGPHPSPPTEPLQPVYK